MGEQGADLDGRIPVEGAARFRMSCNISSLPLLQEDGGERDGERERALRT